VQQVDAQPKHVSQHAFPSVNFCEIISVGIHRGINLVKRIAKELPEPRLRGRELRAAPPTQSLELAGLRLDAPPGFFCQSKFRKFS
jgi:hypothetical protein